jgi:hypothetical protein
VTARSTSRDESPYRDDRARPFTLAPNTNLGGNFWTRTPLGVFLRRWGLVAVILGFSMWFVLRLPMNLLTVGHLIVPLSVMLFSYGLICIAALLIRKRERVSRIASLLAAHGRCGGCAYSLEAIPPEPDGCRICPECGAAWHKDRHVFTAQQPTEPVPTTPASPLLANQLHRDFATDPLVARTLGSDEAASNPKLDDDRGVPMDQPWIWPPKWFGRRSANVVLEAKLQLIAQETGANVNRRLFRMLFVGAIIVTPVTMIITLEFDLDPAVFVIVPAILLLLGFTFFKSLSDTAERATRREAVRQLRMCCNCGHALPNDPPKTFDHCTPCTHCGRAWKQTEAP